MNTKILRQKILDLAIRGRLVPQDPNDEPAAVLLQRIHEEKQRLVKEKKLKKKDLETSPIAEEDKPFQLPQGWEWCRLQSFVSQVTDFVASGSFASLRENVKYYKEENYAVIVRTADFSNNFTKNLTYTDEHGYEFLKNSNLFGGELILSNIGASIGKVFIVPDLQRPMTLGPNSIMVKTYEEIHTTYLYFLFTSLWGWDLLHEISSSTAQGKFNKTDLKNVAIPLPPLSEQRRIVSAVEKWMSVIDALETSAADLQQFTEIAKKRILDLAIRGKLVPQDSNDEPAAILLENIRKEKEKLVKEKKLKKKDIETTPIAEEDKPFQLPQGWEWCRLKEVASFGGGKTPSMNNRSFWDNGKNLWVTSKDMKSKTIVDSLMKITDSALEQMTVYEPGTLLMVTRSGILRRTLPLSILAKRATVNQDLKTISLAKPIDNEFIYYYIKGREQLILKDYHKDGTTVDSINFEKFTDLPIPLPPLSEQRRIVSKVEDLFAAIDTIAQAVV